MCALLLLQHGAFAHALTHLEGERHDAPAELLHQCDVCHAYAAVADLACGHAGLVEPLPARDAASFVSTPLVAHPERVRIATRGPPAHC